MNSSTQVSIESKMNLIINYINKIPKQMLFKTGDDLDKVDEYLDFVYDENPDFFRDNEDFVIRMVIAKHLRVVNMKIINPSILLIVALNEITRTDFTFSEYILVSKLVSENESKFDVDTISKIIAQIRTKLPKDLSSRLTNNHLRLIKNILISNMELLPITINLSEKFQNIDDLDLKNIDTPEELTLFHMELERHKNQDTSYEAQESRNQKLKEIESKQQELIRAKDLEHINRETEDKIMASYVEREPILMKDPELEKMYHYDEYSKSLKRLPKDSELHKVTPEQIEKILQEHDITSDEIQNTLDYLKNNKILDEDASNYVFAANKDYTDRIESEEKSGNIPTKSTIMKKLLIGLSVIVIIVLIVSFLVVKRKTGKK